MRTIIVGGAGEMGQVACATAVTDEAIDAVVIADRDLVRAEALADRLGPKASAQALDLTDAKALRSALADTDLVLNTAGPFFTFGRPVLEAAIETGRHYVDICDDWEPTLEMLELDARARAAGVTCVVGMGASPGLANLLSVVAVEQLDAVTELYTGWRGGSGIPKAPDNPDDVVASAAMDHWIHNLADPIRVGRHGGFESAEALEEHILDYPGLGPATVWTCGHPEPITLPRKYPQLETCLNVMFARPGMIEAARVVRDRVRAGELSVSEGSREFILTPGRRGPDAGPVPGYPGIFAYAVGTKDGVASKAAVSANRYPAGGMGEATCIPMAVAAGMVARGEVTERGVMGPESCLDPETLVRRLAPYADDPEVEPFDIRVAPIGAAV